MGGPATPPALPALLCLRVLTKPSIWADPGVMVAKGSPVTILSPGSLRADDYRLYRERPSGLWEAKAPQDSSNKASFPFESSSSSTAGQYQCVYRSRKDRGAQSPSLSAQPRPVVASGGSVSLACSSQFAGGTLHLLKEGGVYREPSVSAQPGSLVLRGDSLIAGMYRKPSLSAQLWASGPCRENVTLQCGSEVWSDPLHLSKEGSLTPPQHLRLQDTAPPFQNSFTLSPVTSAHSGTYTCYSSLSTSPSLMSQPGDPWSSCSQPLTLRERHKSGWLATVGLHVLQLTQHLPLPHVTARRPLELLLSGSGVQTGLKWYLNVLIGVSVAFVLLPLVLLVRHRGQSRRRKSASPFWKHLPCGLLQPHTWSPLTFKVLNAQVELAGLKSGEPPAEPSAYAALSIHQPRKDPDPTLQGPDFRDPQELPP
ncbi:PREDICTED: leukocyte immunoglobulin-like receptor subfamily B member 1-like [Lipotes vexillifer]|uniref:Leukocyte immunoglobulin-like receptor subfamily B member 1-like n=2 Tax=Lipotes vexillifer TaxID=118797 RepID=A0A340XRH3_LIPVE|nr:PREDICTED: leukocyte immunoglobulin-like receptor subfamily B member 1-like [Lipotes vexillifer]